MESRITSCECFECVKSYLLDIPFKGDEGDAVDQKSDNLVFMTDNTTSMEDVWQKLESSIKSSSDNNGPDPRLVVNPYWGYRPA